MMASSKLSQEAGAGAARSGGQEPMLRVRDLDKEFTRGGRTVTAVQGVSLDVRRGEFLTILGPSGCGKSTLLHIIGGFEKPTRGSVELDGRSVEKPGRDRGMVFQQAMLFPWWTIERNIAWPIRLEGVPRREARRRARELVELVSLQGFEDSYPSELSGGMQQRAALARTLSLEPEVLLMDEPFGALDAQTRELMQEELNRIWQHAGTTVVFVTHDIDEAIFLGDRVLVMSGRPGRIIEDLPVALPRPRDVSVKNGPEIRQHHAHLWELIRAQSSPRDQGPA